MTSIGSVASIAALIGEPARTSMLMALMEGRWLSAGELGEVAGIAPATASGHLGQLLEGGLLTVHCRGRHRYYQLSSSDVALSIERLMSLSAGIDARRDLRSVRTGPRDVHLRYARVCFNHLAGELAVAIVDRMKARAQLNLDMEGGELTSAGYSLLDRLDVPVGTPSRSKLRFCQPCLDWSVRRPHLGGQLGRLLFDRFVKNGWLQKKVGTRIVTVTPAGRCALQQHFELDGA